jgi:ribosomal protein L37E
MGLYDELKRLIGMGTDPLDDEDEDTYVCLRCGEVFLRNRRECSVCGAGFVAEEE